MDGDGTSSGSPSESEAEREQESVTDITPSNDRIRVRFLNQSDVDVETNFFAANEEMIVPRDDLFQDNFKITSAIGVAGTGIVRAGETDEIAYPCGDWTAVGTLGGRYLDPNLGTELSVGQRRVLTVGDNFDCGDTILFAYTGSNGGYFTPPPIVDFRE
jgi:hypothetical protein